MSDPLDDSRNPNHGRIGGLRSPAAAHESGSSGSAEAIAKTGKVFDYLNKNHPGWSMDSPANAVWLITAAFDVSTRAVAQRGTASDVLAAIDPFTRGAFTGWIHKSGDDTITLDEAEDHFSLCMADMMDAAREAANGSVDPAYAPIDLTNHHNALKCPHCNPGDAVRKAVIEECARELETSYPGHAWLNAACAAVRSLSIPSTQSNNPTIDDVPSCGQENDHRRAIPSTERLTEPELVATLNAISPKGAS